MPNQSISPQDDGRVLSRAMAAQYLGVCERTLDNLTKDGEVPHFRLRGRVLYSRPALDTFIQSRQRWGEPLTFADAIRVAALMQSFLNEWQTGNSAQLERIQEELRDLGVFIPILSRNGGQGGDHA